MQRLERHTGQLACWVRAMLMRRHSNVVACALANKLARIVWAIAAHHTSLEMKEAPRMHEGFPGFTVVSPAGFATADFG
jgi:hypothetical protein